MPDLIDATEFSELTTTALGQADTELVQQIEAAPLPGLQSRPSCQELAQTLRDRSGQLPGLFESGLWLLAGDLDRSHSLSQSDGSREGSFWHGIMHRREPDYSNAKYWFARVGEHPVIEQLAREHADIYDSASGFVDEVARACRSGKNQQPLIEIQWTEWQLLMRHCLRQL